MDPCIHYGLSHERIGSCQALKSRGIAPITEEDYEVGGTTSLLVAIDITIQKIINVQKRTSVDERAEKILFVITTDRMENASNEYTAGKIKKLIQHKKEKYDLEFIFLGVNIDVVSTAARFGIDEDFAVIVRDKRSM